MSFPGDFEGQLRWAWDVGRASWPRVSLPADVFVRHLAQLFLNSEGRPLAPRIDQLALGDLYLACACVHDLPGSIERLERHYLAKLPALLGGLKQPAVVLDDVCQSVRIHLLVGTSEAGPRLVDYTGRGALLSWIRVIAVRMALKQGSSCRETSDENVFAALEAFPAGGVDVDLELIKRRYRHEFRQAVRESFAALPSPQRHQLQLHFIDGLSTTQMGALFRVNQSTISRWLKSARQAVFEDTKRRLRERLGLSSMEFTSLLTAIESHFDLGLSQVLGEEG
ncbi:sigma-70 family RNA polymerase sigma factor [Archangium minus]|uniref:Sigma-70 family RNA polymerase sigma factor n=2 Tax=Archangiaceae TaxID=39 RepID=A0ABY9X9Z2_9BACT|nr:sigma-70 family RNA polymerase sigma factor [Archangium violaceum]WNG52186.1 sigma-70 family RNA polymerase sigma factor [Archangium minus]